MKLTKEMIQIAYPELYREILRQGAEEAKQDLRFREQCGKEYIYRLAVRKPGPASRVPAPLAGSSRPVGGVDPEEEALFRAVKRNNEEKERGGSEDGTAR